LALPKIARLDFGVEARIEPPANRDKRVSATDAIEDALRQVTLGQTGLANTCGAHTR